MSLNATEREPTLAQLILASEEFCSRIEAAVKRATNEPAEDGQLVSEILHCRNILVHLQTGYSSDQLSATNRLAVVEFCRVVTSLLWIGFHARAHLDLESFRLLLVVEAEFTSMLAKAACANHLQ